MEENDKVEETQIIVRFNTKLPAQFRVPDTPVTVPGSLTRYGLSQIINHLLGLEAVRPFDFLVKGELLRQTLEELLLAKDLSAELVLDIEYITAVLPPRAKEQLPHDDWVSCVDGRLGGGIISGSFDGIVHLWTGTGEAVGSFTAHRGRVTAVAQLPAVQGANLALTGGQDCSARLWRLPEASGNEADPAVPQSTKKRVGAEAELLALYKGHTDSVAALAVSPQGERFASGGWDSSIHIWRTGQSVVEAAEEARASGAADAAGGRKKRAKSAAAVADGGDADGSAALPALQLGGAIESPSQGLLAGHTQCVSSVAWPTSRCLVSGSWDHSVRRWDVNTGVNTDTLNTSNAVYAVATAPADANGVVAFGGADRSLRFWDSRSSQEDQLAVRACSSHTDWIAALAWSPASEHHLLSASQDGSLKVWDTRSQVPLHTISSHTDKVLCVSWLGPDRIASGGADSVLRICEVLVSSA